MGNHPMAPELETNAEADWSIPAQRFRRALATGNPRAVRSAAAELPDVSLADAAAILLVVERAEPENYERAALDWLARLATEARDVGLVGLARAAAALALLPREPAVLRTLTDVCRDAGLEEVASVLAAGRR